MINKRLASVGLLLVIASAVISANSIEPQPTKLSASSTSDSSPPHAPTLLESAQKEVQKQQQQEATPEAKKSEPAAAAAQPEAKKVEEAKSASSDLEPAADASKRKAKSADASSTTTTSDQKPAADEKDKAAAVESTKSAKPEAAKSSATKSASSQKQSSLSGKSGSGSGKSKLPANLGTVTSTGSGGATHYMSKHDAYSAIAEKHGALAHDAMRKSDKRHSMHSSGHGNPFASSIQKASGLGEMLNPFKGVTDSGLARTLGASMRSIMKSKYSVPAYVASALLGAVALMAFYESPISPLPVPALPNPPVGRFPPELPNISPNVQAPFRTNQPQYGQQYGQQQNYNQRNSLIGGGQQLPQQQQQVFFPSSQPAQQRQGSAGGPVQNLAANLLASVAKPQQNAQRKSGIDYDPSTSRSLFGNNSPFAAPQKAMPATSNHQQRQSNAFLSFFGLGGDSSSGHHQMSGPIEPKGQGQGQAGAASALSNSHLVNKVKSYFRAPSPAGSSSAAGVSNSNPYDQYQRMSFVQALMKDTAFLPGFLTPGNRKSSSPVAPGSSAAGAAKPADSSAAPAAAPANQQVAAAARMQVDQQLLSASNKQQQPAKPSSGYGIVRVAHALLESLGSGIAQRSSQPSERKSATGSDSEQHQSLAAATSLLSDLVSGYTQANMEQNQQQQVNQQLHPQQQAQPQQPQQQQQQAQQQSPPQASQAAPQPSGQQQQPQDVPQAQARSDDEPLIITADDLQFTKKSEEKPLVRKTRSIGLEYPVEVAQPLEQQPSRATQINNVIDFVADSYAQNRMLFNFMMNQVGLSQAVPYVEQILAPTTGKDHQ